MTLVLAEREAMRQPSLQDPDRERLPLQPSVPSKLSSPPAARLRLPGWLNLRAAVGGLLVLVSVFAGVVIVSSADSGVPIWASARNLPVGTVIARQDVKLVQVDLHGTARRYLAAGDSPVGKSTATDLAAGDLLPKSAIAHRSCGQLVSLPVAVNHVPSSIRVGDRVDIFATSGKDDTKTTDRILSAVAVQDISRPGVGLAASTDHWALVVRVASNQSVLAIQAANRGELDAVAVTAPTGSVKTGSEQGKQADSLCSDAAAEAPDSSQQRPDLGASPLPLPTTNDRVGAHPTPARSGDK